MEAVLYLVAIILLLVVAVLSRAEWPRALAFIAAASALAAFSWDILKTLG